MTVVLHAAHLPPRLPAALPYAARVLEACGLPMACILQPFATTDSLAVAEDHGGLTLAGLMRCQACFA